MPTARDALAEAELPTQLPPAGLTVLLVLSVLSPCSVPGSPGPSPLTEGPGPLEEACGAGRGPRPQPQGAHQSWAQLLV